MLHCASFGMKTIAKKEVAVTVDVQESILQSLLTTLWPPPVVKPMSACAFISAVVNKGMTLRNGVSLADEKPLADLLKNK